MLLPVMVLHTEDPSSASTNIPVLAQGVFGGPQNAWFDPEGCGRLLLRILNLAVAEGLDPAPFCPKAVMTSAFATSRMVLLVIEMTPAVALPCTTARMPLPKDEPESGTPWVPIEFPSIFPTNE